MTLHGKNLIGPRRSALGQHRLRATNPATGARLSPEFVEATPGEIAEAVSLASRAFPEFEAAGRARRARFLREIARAIEELGDALLERMHLETALPVARAAGERGRTVAQLRMFADLVEEGSWLDLRIDHAQPDREPVPKPDLRRMNVPLGPVAVFGASNFPLAFSTAGGDTASAFAAGCPVVVKGHPAHPGTGELVAEAIATALSRCELPQGAFSYLHGASHGVGEVLVTHPEIKAVGFTGSIAGGRALFDLAAGRPEPIPVYAEMGSVNPLFILPKALAERGPTIAADLASSITLGLGQFCTKPGIIVVPDTAAGAAFGADLAQELRAKGSGVLLHGSIAHAFHTRVRVLARRDDVEALLVAEVEGDNPCAAAPALLSTASDAFVKHPEVRKETFGPAAILVRCSGTPDMLRVASVLPGQLTATVHHEGEAELEEHRELVRLLTRRAGRLVFNGYPTGVEVCGAQVHGGPYPATTAPASTSVGMAAIQRFLRPVAYQNAPSHLLPPELHDDNPDGLLRMVDGVWSRASTCGAG